MKLVFRVPAFVQLLDWWLYFIPLVLVGISVAMIGSLYYGTPKFSLATGQALYAVIGLTAAILLTRIDYRTWRSVTNYFYVGILLLLIAVDRFGLVIFGAKRWLILGGFQLQPSELAKLVLILTLARFFVERDRLALKQYVWLVILIALPILLVLSQPDLGTAIILSLVSLAMLIVGGVPKRMIIGVIAIGLMALPVGWHFLADYQKNRVMTFINPAADPYGSGYNVLQALIAVGAGGLYGAGLGQGTQTQNQFLPVAHTDFIFASIAEATGFLGSLVLIGLLAFLIYRTIRVAQQSKDQFGYLVAVGIAVLFLSQMTINIAMNMSIAPVTGIPLPFVSHGGTALITNFMAIGILQSIMVRHKRITF